MLDAVLDISRWQKVDSFWDIQRSGVLGVIHKATQGTSWVDPSFHINRDRVRTMKGALKWGSYHFATGDDPKAQADHFLKHADSGLMCLDWESNHAGSTMSRVQAEEFVMRIHEKTGQYPVLYSGESFLHSHMKGVRVSPLAECSLWLARYSLIQPKAPAQWHGWDLWQYTSKGKTPGIQGNVDRNRWKGSRGGLLRWWN